MASQSRRNSKGYSGAGSENGRKGSKEATPDFSINPTSAITAPKFGTIVPERVFVGGISMSMSQSELTEFFSKYGKVMDAKIILDRAGVSKGYGFITFDTEEEAKKLLADADNIMLKERKLNIAPAIKKQTFSQRVEVTNGAANVVGSPLYGSGLPFTFHNGVTYFCQYPNSPSMTSQPTTSQVPPPQPAPPSTPTTHLDPNLYTGYAGITTAAPPYHQVVYNPPIYYQTAQYQFPVTTCEAVEGSMTDAGSMQGSAMAGGSTQVGGPVMLTPNGYYIQDIPPYQEYTYAHPYVTYQPAPDPQPQSHHATVIQFSPASAPPPPQRTVYDSQILLPEPNVGGRHEIRSISTTPQQQPPAPVQLHHQQQQSHHQQQQSHHQQQQTHHQMQQQTHHQQSPPHTHTTQHNITKPKEPSSLPPPRPNNSKPSINHHHHPDTNNNNQSLPLRPPYPHLHHPNPNHLVGSQVFPAPQNIYPRPPASGSTQPFSHYQNNPFSNNNAGSYFRKLRRPYNPSLKGRGGVGRGGGSVSSYSSGGGGGGLVTPPSTPRSGQPSPDHQSSQTSAQDHLVHSLKTLKAA